MKTGCIIQGDIRNNTELICNELAQKFDLVVLSTWLDSEINFSLAENIIVLRNQYPANKGLNHRNYQRYSTANGLRKCKESGVPWVLKWRTDMLPLDLNVNELIVAAQTDVPSGFTSRLVTCSFRNLSVSPDWFSSIPDLFAFGELSVMELLWGDQEFDYGADYNVPKGLDVAFSGLSHAQVNSAYCPESELYALFKDRLTREVHQNLDHEVIVKNYFHLIDHRDLNIIWFGRDGFRPILALYYPWWTVDHWKGKSRVHKMEAYYPSSFVWQKISPYVIALLTKYQTKVQFKKFNQYLFKNGISNHTRTAAK